MKTRLAFHHLLCLILLLLVCQTYAQKEQFYSGTVGKSQADFTLIWQDEGRLTGSYFHPKGKAIVYQLEGSNPSDGVLALRELTNGNLTANITLTKATQDGKIVWSGTMENTDGRKIPVSFSRRQQTRQVPQHANQSNVQYSGLIGKDAVVFALNWLEDRNVSGTYFYLGRESMVRQLEGTNAAEGVLVLKEYTNTILTANIYLSKANRNGVIIWEGTLEHTDSRKVPISFSRNQSYLDKAPSPAISSKALVSGDLGKRKYLAILSHDSLGKNIEGKADLMWSEDNLVVGTIDLSDTRGTILFKADSAVRQAIGSEYIIGKMTFPDGIDRPYYLGKVGSNLGDVIEWRGYFIGNPVAKEELWGGTGIEIDGKMHQGYGSLRLIRYSNGQVGPNRFDEIRKVQHFELASNNFTWTRPSKLNKVVVGHLSEVGREVFSGIGTGFKASVVQCEQKGTHAIIKLMFLKDLTKTKNIFEIFPSKDEMVLTIEDYVIDQRHFQNGDIVAPHFDSQGRLTSIYLGEVAVTHWRYCRDGRVEVMGFGCEDGMDEVFTREEAKACSEKSRIYRPDKIALSTYGGIKWQSVWLNPAYGMMIFLTDAGDGELEFEAAMPVSAPLGEEPWISVFDKPTKPEVVPMEQRIEDAG